MTCKASFQVQDLNTGRYCSTAGGSLYHICMIHTASLHYELKLIPFMIGPSTHPCDPHQTSSPIFSEHSGVIRLVLESWGCDAVDRSLGTFFVMNLHSDPMDRKWVLPKSLKYLCEVWLFFFSIWLTLSKSEKSFLGSVEVCDFMKNKV